MAEHVASLCDQCGQVDDHPKSHWATGETYHFDCLPYDKRQMLVESSDHGHAIIRAATDGKHGEDLRQHISDLHGDS